ncbi:Zn(II)2Cys6 transcription factor domain-containing protein [Aspergillus homomorphus CBS 101889]|uniref:Zn(2)-C6 fungal-type domain-containing protein n=1 Tax=Aspergillus homomorphus (strain CBS 101889) TaxID=1450537 RepID=A0A395HKZ8_ASPHC|nr:hypothetical protein BO97DRAFT_464835 [Aspergillus homomorphus CBS 101889]RAL06964.1 hypothetical protein BO97DRAFT_464835 [Aspergillus homomorphus CBS 101889]
MADQGGTRTRIEESIEAQLRLACEECHARKIRCELSAATSGGRCKACVLNQRQCLFSLRSRTGRPRKQPLSIPFKFHKPSASIQHHRPPAETPPTNHPQTSLAQTGPAQQIGKLYQQRTTGRPLQDGQAHMWSPDDAGWNNGSTWQAQQPGPGQTSPPASFDHFLAPDLRGWNTVGQLIMHGPGIGSLPDPCLPDMGPVGDPLQTDPIVLLGSPGVLNESNGEDPSGPGEKGFLDALKLSSGLHNNCKSTTLDLLTEAGRYKVRVICKLFDELSQAAFALQDDALHASPMVRSDLSEAKIIAVSLREAIQVCIDIIQHNFQIHQSTATAPGDRGSRNISQQQQLRPARPDSRNDQVAGSCICLAGADEKQLGVQQNGLELLICLEFSLIRFRHILSKVESLDGAPPQVNCDCWISSVPKLDTARSQVSALLKHFRNFRD